MLFWKLGFFLTYKCPAKCDMCSRDCSPERTEKISLKTVFSCIDQAKGIKEIKSICVTGGEPFVFFDDLLNIIKYIHNAGYDDCGCVTNCYWATTKEETQRKLEMLKSAGLNQLHISCDSFHQEYIPIENVKRCIDIALNIGINEINVLCIRTKENQGLNQLLPHLDYRKVYAEEAFVMPAGRAENLHCHVDNMLPTPEAAPKCVLLGMLAVTPDGTVYPCCSVGGFTKPLEIGNIEKEPLEEIIKKAKANYLLRVLDRQGPGKLYTIASTFNLDQNIKSTFVNNCDLCYYLLSDPKRASFLAKRLEEEENELILDYLEKISKKYAECSPV